MESLVKLKIGWSHSTLMHHLQLSMHGTTKTNHSIGITRPAWARRLKRNAKPATEHGITNWHSLLCRD